MMQKQRKDEEEEEEEEDRISQLPQSLLHHILCYLSQKDAVKSCVLSRSWRHLGPTRPKIEFREELFNGNHETYLSVLEMTLQRYHDQNLSIQEILIFEMKEGSKSFELLENWILLNMGVNKFHLSIDSARDKSEPGNFKLPTVLLKSKFLQQLSLKNCQIDPLVDNKVLCKHLRKLCLRKVYITDATLENIMSSCPLIEDLNMDSCKGLKTIKLTHNLKFFSFITSLQSWIKDFESWITIWPSWIHNPNMYFPRLKSLRLRGVRLSNETIDFFSTNFPCLEYLHILFFFDSEQLKLSSRSIKHLIIEVEGLSLKSAIIDATNILCFDFSCEILPSISFTTTSTEWKSIIRVGSTFDSDNDASSWFRKLSETCKALSASEISLLVEDIPKVVPDTHGDQLFVIENLSLELEGNSFSSVPDFLNCLFRNFRPRSIRQTWYADLREKNQLIELLCKILLSESERGKYFGLQNLEGVKMEASYENDKEWRGVEGTSSLSEFALPWNRLMIRIRLKWIE